MFQQKEVQIQVPWGHIAGKWYGSENKQPILMVHGWQDNAGSFDTLIPLLPQDQSYLAIDLPGHGYSSHLPHGFYYHSLDLVPMLEQIRVHFDWKRISLVAHSMGSIVAFVYASLFPGKVNLVCALDSLKMFSVDPKQEAKICTWRMKNLMALRLELIQNPPSYTYDELVRRVYEGSKKSVDIGKAKYLIARGTRPCANHKQRFCFQRDIRVKFIQTPNMQQHTSLEFVKRIQAPYLFIRGNDRDFSEAEENISQAVDVFQQFNNRFEIVRIQGTHHFHLNQPELIAAKISEFLQKYHL